MKTWYAVYTQPRNEALAAEHLSRQGATVYFPRYLKQRRHARRVDIVPAPLFPRYLFISFDAAEFGWRAVRSTRGVSDLVTDGLYPIAVPPGIIDELRQRSDTDGYVVLARQADLGRGDRIRIDRGPFADYEAVFEAQRDNERVVALLSLLGRKVLVSLPIGAVAPA